MKAKDYNTVLNERVNDVKALFFYFNVTRVRKFYIKRDGSFYINSYDTDNKFYNAYRNRLVPKTTANRVRWGRIRQDWNLIHDIPKELLYKVIGHFKKKWIPKDEIFKHIPDSEYKSYNAGQKRFKGEIKDSWCQKWIMTDIQLLRSYICDPRFDNIENIPNASVRVKKIIKDWEANNAI